MFAVAEALTGLAGPHPAILDAGDAVGIERDCGLRTSTRPHHQLVPHRESDKRRHRRANQHGVGIALDRHGPVDQDEHEDGDLGIAERDVASLARSSHGLALGKSRAIDFKGCRHQAFNSSVISTIVERKPRRSNRRWAPVLPAADHSTTRGMPRCFSQAMAASSSC